MPLAGELAGDSINQALRSDPLLRKERILEALQLLSVQQQAQGGVLRRHLGFSAEEVAEWASVDRTNASRDLNLLAQEGKIERIPGRPVLFSIKEYPSTNEALTRNIESASAQHTVGRARGKVNSLTASSPTGAVQAPLKSPSISPPANLGTQRGERGGDNREQADAESRSYRPSVSTPDSPLYLPRFRGSRREDPNQRTVRAQGHTPTPQPIRLPDSQEHGKPPAVSASVQVGAIVTSFETLIGGGVGLKVAVQQAKAAMLYPPHGLHSLLAGPSGVGKTTFARLMHVFAQEHNALPPDAPFISFNCADYAGNPQLLMAHLFGVVRGAYTGAERDRVGLVEQAHRGILFLDEVHRLPPEGQEMLFHLMDRERFRRLGDSTERHASLLLLAATTEDPSTALLPTFRRRIPMVINLPGLHERSMTERYELLRAFFTTECSGIGANISVTPQALQALLLYECPGNVGQLRTDVQLACARAYLEYRTNNTSELSVDLHILPDHVRSGLLRTAELHRSLELVWREPSMLDLSPQELAQPYVFDLSHSSPIDRGRFATFLEATHIFTPTGLSLDSVPESAQDLYATIGNDLNRLRRNGVAENEISRLLHLDIQSYFQRFADQVAQERPGTPSHLVDEHIAEVSRGIVLYAEEQLRRVFPTKLALVLAMHLTSTLERIASGQQIDGSLIQSMRRTYPIEYEVARMAMLQFRSALGVTLPESETDVLAVLLANADALLSNEQSTVGIVVAAHGRGIAGGLAELANTLVGVNSVRWVELTLEQSPEELVAQVADWVRVADQGGGVLLLVDFVSLLSLGELVTRQAGVQVRTISGVSAPLVVEAVRRAQRPGHLTLDQLAASLTLTAEGTRKEIFASPYSKNGTWEDGIETSRASLIGQDQGASPATDLDGNSLRKPRVILSVCLTGFGSAAKIAELIEQRLPDLRQQGIEIVCMDISLSSKTQADVQRMVGDREVVAIVGTINPHLESYPFIALTDFLFGDGVARLRTLLGKTLIDPALLQPAGELIDSPQMIHRRIETRSASLEGSKSGSEGVVNHAPTEHQDAHPPSKDLNVFHIPTMGATENGSFTAHVPMFMERSDLMREITNTLSEHLLFLNPARAMPLIERMIELIEVEVGETFDIEVLAGLVLHLACIMERGMQQRLLVSETVRTQVEQQFPRELSICRGALQVLSAQIAHPLPDEEAYNIVGILRQVDIFIGDTV